MSRRLLQSHFSCQLWLFWTLIVTACLNLSVSLQTDCSILCVTTRAGQWVTNFGTVGNRYDFEFSILLIEMAGRIVFTHLTVYLIVYRISTNRVKISL